jgi:prepilin-type N-terminal cleavage/methylation domain-containing protein
MKKLIRIRKSACGFTLIEVIITITLAAILGSFLVTFMGSALTRSADPIVQARHAADSKGKMEKISAAYAFYTRPQTPILNRSAAEWTTFTTALTNAGAATEIINDFKGSGFDVIKVTFTVGNQTFVSYYPKVP